MDPFDEYGQELGKIMFGLNTMGHDSILTRMVIIFTEIPANGC